MLKVNAAHYIEAGEVFARIDSVLGPSGTGRQSHQEAAIFIIENLRNLRIHCAALRMSVTQEMIRAFFAKHQDDPPTPEEARTAMQSVRAAFKAEIGAQCFLYVLPHRVSFAKIFTTLSKE